MKKIWKTRKHGTPKQVGSKFPIGEKKKLPPKIIRPARTPCYYCDATGIDPQTMGKCPDCKGRKYFYHRPIKIFGGHAMLGGGKVTSIQLEPLLSPYTGAPLEPAPEYGSSILYDPYSQSFVMVSVPEARIAAAHSGGKEPYIATPRFTIVEQQSLDIAKNYLTQAGSAAVKGDKEGVRQAIRHLDDADRTIEHEIGTYPTAGFKKDAVGKAILEAKQYAMSMWHSYQETKAAEESGESIPGGLSSKDYLKRASERIVSARDAIAGVGGKVQHDDSARKHYLFYSYLKNNGVSEIDIAGIMSNFKGGKVSQLVIGAKIEMEHTKSKKRAREIAQDHLKENPNYYRFLIPMEKAMRKIDPVKFKKTLNIMMKGNTYKVGDKVLLAHFKEPSIVDYVRKDGCLHLKGDPKIVWCNPNCIKPYKK